jgi:hypothetical protein
LPSPSFSSAMFQRVSPFLVVYFSFMIFSQV